MIKVIETQINLSVPAGLIKDSQQRRDLQRSLSNTSFFVQHLILLQRRRAPELSFSILLASKEAFLLEQKCTPYNTSHAFALKHETKVNISLCGLLQEVQKHVYAQYRVSLFSLYYAGTWPYFIFQVVFLNPSLILFSNFFSFKIALKKEWTTVTTALQSFLSSSCFIQYETMHHSLAEKLSQLFCYCIQILLY